MIRVTKTFYILAVFSVLVLSRNQVLGQDIEDIEVSKREIREVVDGSGNGEMIGGNTTGETVEGSGDGEAVDRKRRQMSPECTPEFKNEKDHTMCKIDDKRVVKSGVSDQEKKLIVNLHNKLRGEVKPPATNLMKVIWDDKIAAVAAKLAKQCKFEHDKNRKVPSYHMSIGQNIAVGYSDWTGAIMGWWNEYKLYRYGEDPKYYLNGKWGKIGHYTQMVQSGFVRIGCGFAKCKSSQWGRYYVCNYGTGQSQSTIITPYEKGKRCSKCPNSCKNGVCDCSGKMCRNGGKLDINSCTCKCLPPSKGPTCEQVTCPSSDNWKCGKYPLTKLCKAATIKKCPYMCGLCGSSKKKTPPPTFTSKFNCVYKGTRPPASKCQSFGENGSDKQACATRGGDFNCGHCIKYSNVPEEYCPVMCGLCDGPCDGKNCKNKGTLNTSTCKCKCPAPFSGEFCEKVDCSNRKDSPVCGTQFPPAYCKKYSNVPGMCPWMCGLCRA